jgi:hypothetical protein
MNGQVLSTDVVQGLDHPVNIIHMLDLGNHHVTHLGSHAAYNQFDIVLKVPMVYGMDASRHPGALGSFGNQLTHQLSVIALCPHRCTVLTIQGDIKHASTQILDHLGLQVQTFLHPSKHTTVVIAHGKPHACGLCVQQHVTWVTHDVLNKKSVMALDGLLEPKLKA